MNIEVTSRKTEGVERLLEVTVPVEDVKHAENKAARQYATRAKLPGFRPGKVPPAILRKHFGQAIRQEAIELVVQQAYKELVEREGFKVATQPRVEHVHFDEGKPLTFELHVELHPEIALSRTHGFRVTRNARVVTEDQLHEQISALRDQRATWTPVTEKPMPGDMVNVVIATATDSGEMSEGKDYRMVLGSGQAIPAIEELIMEAEPGQTVQRSVKWPDDFPDEAQRGKMKQVRLTLNDVKRQSLPELTDAFAREIGDFDSLEALKSAVRGDLQRHADKESDAEVRQALMDDILGANPFDVPPSWVNELVKAYAEAYKVPEAEREKFSTEFRPMAERQVRRDLVIETIAERENLKSTEADIDARVAEVAEKRGADAGQVYASLQKAGRVREIERTITEEKVFAWLMEKNEVQ